MTFEQAEQKLKFIDLRYDFSNEDMDSISNSLTGYRTSHSYVVFLQYFRLCFLEEKKRL